MATKVADLAMCWVACSAEVKKQATNQGGGLGDILGGVLGAGDKKQGGGMGLEDLIGAALNQFGHNEQAVQTNSQPKSFEDHSPGMVHSEACDQATLIIRGMVNAAKSDGRLDKEEQANITGKLGNVTQDEIDFVNNELAQPLDVQGFINSIPRGMGKSGLCDVVDCN